MKLELEDLDEGVLRWNFPETVLNSILSGFYDIYSSDKERMTSIVKNITFKPSYYTYKIIAKCLKCCDDCPETGKLYREMCEYLLTRLS